MDIHKKTQNGGPKSYYDEMSTEHEDYDSYGKTPPRTRILRKSKEKKYRDKDSNGCIFSSMKPSPKMPRNKKISRRNTVSVMFDELMAKAENPDADQAKRSDKKSAKLLRGSERDLKLDIASAQHFATTDTSKEVDDVPPMTPQPSVQVEGCKQFKSLCSRRVICSRRQVRSVSGNFATADMLEIAECPPSRVEFHKMLSMLVRMGCGEKQVPERGPRRNLSREEHLWQNELKDLIWLELQAWHADRSVTDEDNYLCMARDSVGGLLTEIMMYRFRRHRKRLSVHSSDSGVVTDDCAGCLSMFCQACLEAQNEALRDIEELLSRLETAESLFPSSKAFAEVYPLYNSLEFVGRVKAMCLWYNMMKHQRLKMSILGRLLAFLGHKDYIWPFSINYDGCSVDSSSPSDSNSSNSSNDYLTDRTSVESYMNPIPFLVSKSENKASPYRKYIENILKTKGLSRSLNFLDKLHEHILRKVQVTLEKPEDDSIFSKVPDDCQDEELRRYGSWSPEAQSLGLPPYKAIFLFLSGIPLEVTHEFLLMRLEQKPKNPSPLSIRQLMRELKEGLKIAIRQRQRIIMYFHTALKGSGDIKDSYVKSIDAFDESLLKLFEDYLEYLGQWALLQHDTFQKNLLEEEWHFIREIKPDVIGGWPKAVKKICSILCALLNLIGERLLERIEELALEAPKEDDVNRKQILFSVLRELQSLFKEEREMSIKTLAFSKTVIKDQRPIVSMSCETLDELKTTILSLKCTIPVAIERVQNICDVTQLENLEDIERASFVSRCREILLQGYRFGFEFYKEMSEFVPKEGREKLARSMLQFAQLWMKFARERCERGRGKRPRWAYQGLDFLLTVCEPQHTRYLSESEFEELKVNMDACISHVIGTTAPTTPDSGYLTGSPKLSVDLGRTFPRSRGSSPSPRPTYKSQRSNSRKASVDQSSPSGDQVESPVFSRKMESLHESLIKIRLQPALRSERLLDSVLQLENELDSKLREEELIGQVVSCTKDPAGKLYFRRRQVTFSWQRGIKIGQGRFGKVYTAVNNNTGEMLAVKEVALQRNDMYTLKKVAEELKILEGITHKNLVRYYGLEVHKEEMLIFMEFCPEGTLESLVAGTEDGLPEELIRQYTFQLLSGVAVLHERGIVHRDIKTANIFLTDEGNCLKIGDFGCAVKIKSNFTMPGELQGFVGTQAYMAPEMFMTTTTEGHGRAADIWSVGCVIVELAAGKRPWAEYDSNYQIMFKVGMGERPEAPASLIDEGHDFLDRCLQHNPKDRATASDLLNHNFVKVGGDSIIV